MQKKENVLITEMRMTDGNIVRIESHDTLPSTSELAKKYARDGYGDRYVVFAEKQTTSKIIGTKLSENEIEHGMFMSVILRPSMFVSQVGNLSPLVLVALLTGIDEYTTKTLECGWFSDIYCEGKKIGGTSIEGKLDQYLAYEYIILSFAVRLDEQNFPPRLSDMVRKVFEDESISIPMIMAKNVLKKLFTIYSGLKNPSKYIDVYRKRCVLSGKVIRYIENDKKYKCRVLGIDPDCRLIIEDKDKKLKHISDARSIIIPTKFKFAPKKIKISNKKL